MFELVEAAFDSVSGSVEGSIVGDSDFPRALGGYDGCHVLGCNGVANFIRVVGFIGDNATCAEVLEQDKCGFAIMHFASR